MPYSLRARTSSFVPGEETTWEFEVVSDRGRPESYRIQHERELHLIVVRDDLSTFAHLHPRRDQHGFWSVNMILPVPGSYTAFADVAPNDSEPLTLRLPLTAEGEPPDEAIFEPSFVATTDGYRIELVGDIVAGDSSNFAFRVTKDGEPVEPDAYLGAAGHLVAIRAGDLEYLHVHPLETSEVGSIPFMIHAQSPGRYRLFLQFLHDSEVRTADFTIEVAEGTAKGSRHHH